MFFLIIIYLFKIINYELILLLSIVISFTFISCEVSPCNCARAEMYNDSETKQECDEKRSSMTQSEEIEFNKEAVKYINQGNY